MKKPSPTSTQINRGLQTQKFEIKKTISTYIKVKFTNFYHNTVDVNKMYTFIHVTKTKCFICDEL